MCNIIFSQLTIFVALFLVILVDSRRYHAHDRISLAANTVGPFNNPTETYPVSALIFVINCDFANLFN